MKCADEHETVPPLASRPLPSTKPEGAVLHRHSAAGIVCADLTELTRLTALLGHPEVEVSADPNDCGLVFFTEYGISESAYGPAAERFAGLSTARDTPDVVFLTTRPRPVLFALEAKMYDRPGGALRGQLDLQRELLEPLAVRLASWLGVASVPISHAALLPKQQSVALALDPYPVVTWQQIGDVYADIAPAYWLTMLDEALSRYDDLVSRAVANDADRLTGETIVARYVSGDLPYAAMGRASGLDGAPLQADITSGSWRDTQYQVARDHPGNRNWFAVEEFVSLIEAASGSTGDAVADLHGALAYSASVGLRVFGDGSVAQTISDAPIDAFVGVPAQDVRRVAESYRAAAEAAKLARSEATALFDRVTRTSGAED